MSELEKFDFAGLSEEHLRIDEEHGPLMQANAFIKWAGWTNPTTTIQNHLQDGDTVLVKVRDGGPNAFLPDYERYLTRRGARRLLFRSKSPQAVEYTDHILDLMDSVDEARRVGIDVFEEVQKRLAEVEKRNAKLEVAAKEADEYAVGVYHSMVRYQKETDRENRFQKEEWEKRVDFWGNAYMRMREEAGLICEEFGISEDRLPIV